MPFLRLTRDRRGFENTFLMHADRPGDRPRLLYWYRTAPGVIQGRGALDEDAIRAIEEQHPDIDFDWPAIIALSEVMTPEEEAPPPRSQQQQQQQQSASARKKNRGPRRDDRARGSGGAVADLAQTNDAGDKDAAASESEGPGTRPLEPLEPVEPVEPTGAPSARGLIDELAGREISARLRARYAEIVARIEGERSGAAREEWLARAEAIDPDAWESPDAVLEGVRRADALFETLKAELDHLSIRLKPDTTEI